MDEEDEHWMTTVKRGVLSLRKFAKACQTPIDPSDYILEHGRMKLDTNSGILTWGDVIVRMKQSLNAYKILKLLLLAHGNEVPYESLAKVTGFTSTGGKLKDDVGTCIRDLRKRIKVNSKVDNQDNPFVPTGKGYKIAYFGKL